MHTRVQHNAPFTLQSVSYPPATFRLHDCISRITRSCLRHHNTSPLVDIYFRNTFAHRYDSLQQPQHELAEMDAVSIISGDEQPDGTLESPLGSCVSDSVSGANTDGDVSVFSVIEPRTLCYVLSPRGCVRCSPPLYVVTPAHTTKAHS